MIVMNKEQLLKEFVKFYCDNSENTAKSYVRSVNEYLTFTMSYTNWSLEELIEKSNKRNILMFVAMLNERGLSPYTVNVYTSGVETFFQFLVEFDYKADNNPVNNVRRQNTKGVKQKQEYLTEEEYKRLLNVVKIKVGKTKKFEFVSARDTLMFTLNLTIGLRVSETLSLTVEQFKDDIITIKGKGDKLRSFKVNKEIRDCFNAYMRVRNQAFKVGQEDCGLLFVTISGNEMCTKDVNKNIKKYSERAKIDKDLSSHCLRRSCITRYLDMGVPIQQVAKLSGHSNCSTTMRYYKSDGTEFDFVNIGL
jgi:integrase/recombinase XerD